jgi:hypothetical protein
VYGRDGKAHAITRLMSRQHKGKMLTIKARKMLAFSCTTDHPILVASVKREAVNRRTVAGYEWKAAIDIEPGDYLVVPKLKEASEEMAPDLAYMMGRYVGDGASHYYKENGYDRGYASISFGQAERDQAEQMMATVVPYGGAKIVETGPTVQLRFGRTTVGREFKERFGYSAATKRIPIELMHATPETTRDFLRGYFDADGYSQSRDRENERAQYHRASTVSCGLALQMQFLATKLGAFPSLVHQERRDREIMGRMCDIQDRWLIEIAGGDAPMAFGIENTGNRRAGLFIETEDNFLVEVVNIESSDFDDTVYDLTCDGHTFLVNNMVVHNCGQGVNDQGERDRPRKGEKLAYNARLKSVCYLISTSFLKTRSPYRVVYDDAKTQYERTKVTGNKETDWTPAHVHMASMRKMVKVFLAHLWVTWRTVEGLPTRALYVHEYLGHTSVYAAEDFGWPTTEQIRADLAAPVVEKKSRKRKVA